MLTNTHQRLARASFAIALVAVGASALGNAKPAWCESKSECLLAYENTQLLRRKGELRGARAAARQCARAECNDALRRDCVAWVPEIEKDIPTVIFRARRGDRDLSVVRVSVDGERVTERLDGRGVEVDAGEHQFNFEAEGLPHRETRALIALGEKNRIVSVDFGGLGAKPAPAANDLSSTPAASTWSPWQIGAVVAAGVGLGGLGVGLGFGLDARSKRDQSNRLCDGDLCLEQRGLDLTDQAHRSATISTIAFAVGGLGIATGAGLWIFAPEAPQVRSSTRFFPPSLSVSLAPTGARLCGTFE